MGKGNNTDVTIIEIEVEGQELVFEIGVTDFNEYLNAMTPTNKVGPAHNFLMRNVVKEYKDALRDVLKQPTAEVQIAGKIVEEYMPDLSITVGKSKASPKE